MVEAGPTALREKEVWKSCDAWRPLLIRWAGATEVCWVILTMKLAGADGADCVAWALRDLLMWWRHAP